MRITAAQPLAPGPIGGQLEPSPTLTEAEAQAEASVFSQDAPAYVLQAIDDIPVGQGGLSLERLRLTGRLDSYTHHLQVSGGPTYACRDYLVRIEP